MAGLIDHTRLVAGNRLSGRARPHVFLTAADEDVQHFRGAETVDDAARVERFFGGYVGPQLRKLSIICSQSCRSASVSALMASLACSAYVLPNVGNSVQMELLRTVSDPFFAELMQRLGGSDG
jgi:hypothetical protein